MMEEEEILETSDIEQSFMEDAPKSFIVSIGMKRHGKTFLMLQFLKHSLMNKVFEEYHLVLPQFGHERDNAYQFLKGMKDVYIYDRYHELISKKILKQLGKKHTCFVIDDGTGELGSNFDDSLKKLVTCNEHGKSCMVWMCIHAGRRVLPPLARGMLNYLFLYYTTNQLMLKGFWEEYFSKIYKTFDEFVQVYDNAVEREVEGVGKVNAICFAITGKHEMDGVVDWELPNMKFDFASKKKDEKKAPKTEKKQENNTGRKLLDFKPVPEKNSGMSRMPSLPFKFGK